MLSLADVLELPVVRRALPELVTGGVGCELRWAHVIEMRDPDDLLKGGELVLTTGLGAGNEPGHQSAWISSLLDQRGDPGPLMRRLVAGPDPGGQHELAALEQIIGIAHLDHVRPAQLAIDAARDQLRQGTPDHRQLEHIRETQHDALSIMMAQRPTDRPL